MAAEMMGMRRRIGPAVLALFVVETRTSVFVDVPFVCQVPNAHNPND